MAFTYDSEHLSAPLNHLRFLIQDTADDGHFFEDAEITFINSQEKNIYRAAARLCRSQALKVLKRAGIEEKEGIQYKPEDKAKEYRAMAKDFDLKAEQLESEPAAGADGNASGGGSLNLPKLRSSSDSTFTRKTHFSN